MQILSLTWGILAIIGMFVGLIPCVGALNWLNIPFAVVGLIVSLVSHSSNPGSRRTGSLVGIILCVLAIVIGFKRLVLGGGII